MKILALTGRILFSILFLVSAPDHFHSDMVRRAADNGLLFAPILVPASGIAVFIGGLSVLLGWKVSLAGQARANRVSINSICPNVSIMNSGMDFGVSSRVAMTSERARWAKAAWP